MPYFEIRLIVKQYPLISNKTLGQIEVISEVMPYFDIETILIAHWEVIPDWESVKFLQMCALLVYVGVLNALQLDDIFWCTPYRRELQ